MRRLLDRSGALRKLPENAKTVLLSRMAAAFGLVSDTPLREALASLERLEKMPGHDEFSLQAAAEVRKYLEQIGELAKGIDGFVGQEASQR
ncbi:MAG: hypothetical protein HY303_16675 [Candidatus Wallbacteria bacterium]|nr:hypothetical protein [Candidatus Wallbacteria bacterium]